MALSSTVVLSLSWARKSPTTVLAVASAVDTYPVDDGAVAVQVYVVDCRGASVRVPRFLAQPA
ncbi:hypothetical protein MRBLWO14_003554 [Microbacterium sp. LWO14-1.2]|uniref:hypothetical protein n=1 Tax=Microbacterium sp. LWO14-1.2 TaxID=3135263 RepID=UPI00313A2211